ncbi:MAG: tetratricopeptide repeat protein [bacterium]|nr:tetratricopeptide repeat protein [bacterium]MBU1918381.1 tetratricopeptide repeat protein [bacterium]
MKINKLIIFVIACSLITTSCATMGKKAVPTKRPPIYDKPVIDSVETQSPAKELLKEGITHLKEKAHQKAEWKFEEAIKLDPDYGPAYYWLARARYRLNQIKDIIYLLEKAELLLKNSTTWIERIQKFKDLLYEKTGY